MRWLVVLCLLFSVNRNVNAQLLPEFWFSPTSDTLLMIEPRGVSSTNAYSYIYIMGAPTADNKTHIGWFRAYMDSTKNKSFTGYDLLKADTLRKYNLKLRGELLTAQKVDSIDLYYPLYDTHEIEKGQDSSIHIFHISYQIQLKVGRELVIETRQHQYEYMGASVEEAYEKTILTVHGWMVPGKRRQLWMLGCGDVYHDIPHNQVMSFPANYFGFR